MKKTLVKLLAMLLVLAMAFILCGCGTQAVTDAFPDAQVGGAAAGEIVGDFIAAALRLVLLGVTILLTKVVLPLIKNTIVPYLEQKRVFSIIQTLVRAAEKKGETSVIPKEQKLIWVIAGLERLGVAVTNRERDMIEAAVEELDKMGGQIIEAVIGEPEETAPTAEENAPDY